MSDQSDRPRENEESVQAIDWESDIDQYGRHGPIDVQNQVIFFDGGNFLYFQREIQAWRLDVQALHVPNQFLHSLVWVTQTLHAMTNSWNRPMVFLHVGHDFVDRHLVINCIFKESSGISDRTAEARTNHNHACGD